MLVGNKFRVKNQFESHAPYIYLATLSVPRNQFLVVSKIYWESDLLINFISAVDILSRAIQTEKSLRILIDFSLHTYRRI